MRQQLLSPSTPCCLLGLLEKLNENDRVVVPKRVCYADDVLSSSNLQKKLKSPSRVARKRFLSFNFEFFHSLGRRFRCRVRVENDDRFQQPFNSPAIFDCLLTAKNVSNFEFSLIISSSHHFIVILDVSRTKNCLCHRNSVN